MRILKSISLLGLVMASLFSCVGVHENKNVEGLVITASTSNAIIGEGNEVSFIVTYNGVEVNENCDIYYNIEGNPETFELEGKVLDTRIEGKYTFFAIYDYIHTSNKVTVKITRPGDGSSGKFYRRVSVMYHTGTWCSYCPLMANAIKSADKANPNRLITIAQHNNDEFTTGTEEELERYFMLKGFPTAVIDFRQLVTQSTSSLINSAYLKSYNDYPAVLGIGAKTELKDNKITIDVKVAFKETNEYKIAVALVEDGYQLAQAGVATPSYTHNYILRGYANDSEGNNSKNFGVSLGKRLDGEEYTGTFTMDFISVNPSRPHQTTWNSDNCRIVIYVMNKNGDKNYINNIIELGLNATKDYEYEVE